MSKYQIVNLETLTNAMSNNTVTNKWDVLCSYGIKSLNKVLQEEHKKYSTNTRITFNKLINSDVELLYKYDIKFGSPTVSFDANVDGIYNIKMPIDKGSSVDTVLKGELVKSHEIPQGYYLLASGPVQCIKGEKEEGNVSKHDAGSIIEFGKNDDKASIVLHFGNDLRQIEPFIDSGIPSNDDVKNALDKIDLTSFIKNITEINYNITQVKVNSNKQDGVVLTPKTFIFTTMGSEDDKENGAINIWIQTNESNNEKGNPKPSFYVGKNLLPIPKEHNASIIFSKQLIQVLYLKPQLEKLYKVTPTNLDLDNNPLSGGISFTLIPKNNPEFIKDYSYNNNYIGFVTSSYEFKCNPLKIDFETNNILLNISGNQLQCKWQWEQTFDYHYSSFTSSPPPPGGQFPITSSNTEYGKCKIKAIVNKSVSLDKITDNKLNVKFTINKEEIQIDSEPLEASSDGWFLDFISGVTSHSATLNVYDDIKTKIVSLLAVDVDCKSLNYFSEANILFNEQRFAVNTDLGLNVPADVMLIGDIE